MGEKELHLRFSKRQIMIMLAVLTVSIFATKLGTETMTLITYYPAPYGAYAKFRTTKDTFLATHKGSKLGIGTLHPSSRVTVNGGMTIGNAYIGTASPSDGLTVQGKVGIGTKKPQAPLEIYSKRGGFLPPRLTTAERNAISRPTAGTLVYNNQNKCYNYYNGTEWKGIECEPEQTTNDTVKIPWNPTESTLLHGGKWYRNANMHITLTGFTKPPVITITLIGNHPSWTTTYSCSNITKGGFDVYLETISALPQGDPATKLQWKAK